MANPESYIWRVGILPVGILLLQLLCFWKTVLCSIAAFFTPWVLPRVVRTPESSFKHLEGLGYSFAPNYVDLPIGGKKTLPRVHYVDEGSRDAQETILCLHGEPSWSFLYRHMIHIFVKAGYRVIAPDFIGFGKSDKYTHPESYTHDLHTQTLRLLLDQLKVERLTLVCQDTGGLVGLTVVKDCPHLFSRLVIMNTGLPVGPDKSDLFNDIQNGTQFLLWRSIAQLFGTYQPIKQNFNFTLKNPTPDVLEAYCAPFPTHLYKGGAAQWPLLVPITSTTPVASEMQETRDYLRDHWSRDTLLMFADGDPITHGELKTLQKILPNAITKIVPDAGHFLQEDKGAEVANNIVDFIGKKK